MNIFTTLPLGFSCDADVSSDRHSRLHSVWKDHKGQRAADSEPGRAGVHRGDTYHSASDTQLHHCVKPILSGTGKLCQSPQA